MSELLTVGTRVKVATDVGTIAFVDYADQVLSYKIRFDAGVIGWYSRGSIELIESNNTIIPEESKKESSNKETIAKIIKQLAELALNDDEMVDIGKVVAMMPGVDGTTIIVVKGDTKIEVGKNIFVKK